MRILIAPDSFKGSLSARAAACSLAKGIALACPDAEIDILPIGDGGEGTLDALLDAVGGEKVWVPVQDPLGCAIDAEYGVLSEGTVVIEIATAAGLGMVADADPGILYRNTHGVGELIRHALEAGRTKFVVGLGGSATNDGGIGMLYALGARFYDPDGGELEPTPASCHNLAHIDTSGLHPALTDVTMRVACDVTNPLCGPMGASAVYGPQKGATEELILVLDAFLERFAMVVSHDIGISIRDIPGAGAAGGLGAAFVGLLGAQLVKGIDLILDLTSFDTRVRQADVVLTGEGRTDSQTQYGKAVMGVATRAKSAGIPVFCLSGSIAEEASFLYDHGVTALFSITQGPTTLTEAMHASDLWLAQTAEAAMRAFLAGRIPSLRPQ